MKLYVAACSIRYTDYGSHLETVKGIIWCDEDGNPRRGSFERGKTLEDVKKKFADIAPPNWELVICKRVGWTCDMNPRGDI